MDQQQCRRPAQDQVVAAGIFVPQMFEAGKIGVHLGEGHAEQGPENRVFELAHHRGERIDRETADPLERLGRGDQRESHLLLVAGRRSPMGRFHDPLQHLAGYRFAGEGAVRAPCPAEQHHLFGRRQVVSVEGMHPFGREAVVQDGAVGQAATQWPHTMQRSGSCTPTAPSPAERAKSCAGQTRTQRSQRMQAVGSIRMFAVIGCRFYRARCGTKQGPEFGPYVKTAYRCPQEG